MSGNYSAPAGKLILPVDADRDAWLRTRMLGVGGTDVATLMGANKYQTVFEAWQSKFSDPVEEPSEAMWWGQQTEALTVSRFEELTGLGTRRAGTYASRTAAHHLVNPDRFTSDGGVLEVKDHESLSEAGKTVLSGQITDHAWVQLQWAMHVTGRTVGWFAAKVGKQARVLGPFHPSPMFVAEAVAAADRFWGWVQAKTPPPVDLATITLDEVAVRFPTVTADTAVEVDDLPIPDMYLDDIARLGEIRDLGERFAEERAGIEARLKALIGEREFLTVHGRPVFRWQQVAGRRGFDQDAAVDELARLTGKTPVEVRAEFVKQGAPSRRFSPVETKQKAEAA